VIVDASAVLAILLLEPEAPAFAAALAGLAEPRMSAVTYLEVAIRLDRADNAVAVQKFDDFMALTKIAVQPVSLSQMRLARLASAEFGTRRHPAGLNFGDCFACARAKETDLPLLLEGNGVARAASETAVQPTRSTGGRSP